MSPFARAAAVALVLVAALVSPLPAAADRPRVVVVAGTDVAARAAVDALSAVAGPLGIDLAEVAPAELSRDALAGSDGLVLAGLEGRVLDAAGEAALVHHVRAGAGLLALGSSIGVQPGSVAMTELLGARPRGAVAPALGEVQVVDRVHPATAALPTRWPLRERFVPLAEDPTGRVHVLAWVDERSYGPAPEDAMGLQHPVVWCQQLDAGRSLTSTVGQEATTFADPAAHDHLAGALAFTAGLRAGDCGATVWANWRKTTVDDQITDGTELEVAPDGRVYYTEHVGSTLRMYDPATGIARTVGAIPSVLGIEGGLLGLALDPDFLDTGWVYTFRHVGLTDVRISRWTLLQDRTVLDPTSESVVLDLAMTFIGHQGGGLEFGPDGTLYIAVGDNVNGGCCEGYAPIDEQSYEGSVRPFDGYSTDSQHSAANSDSLLGKVLRIRPEPEGGYTIPEGNLFPPGTPSARPEIYTMGHRNVFHIKVDSATGDLLWGDVGNDAFVDDPERGPRGYDEFNRTSEPGFFGWPYCIADNQPFRDHDFATGTSGDWFDCAAAINDSPRNTGLRELPPARPALIWYPYDVGEDFPELHEGAGARVAIPGPVHHVEDAPGGSMPAFFDDTWFIADLARSWIKTVTFDEDGGVLRIQRFAPDLAPVGPIDMDIAPDGSLYVMEFGQRTQLAGDPLVAKVSRYTYVGPVGPGGAPDAAGQLPGEGLRTGAAMPGGAGSAGVLGLALLAWLRRRRVV